MTMKKNILIAEDEQIIAEILSNISKLIGYNSIITTNGVEALKFFKENNFDLIITDIHMPEMDGYQLIKEIRKTNKQVPILVLSGFIDNEHISKVLNIGANGYIEKPFTIANIKSILKEFI
jgi:YesN/AraC family two-component response regulator